MLSFEKKFLYLYEELASENYLPSSGTSLALYFLLTVCQAEAQGQILNKSAVLNKGPCKLGSLTRRRHVLDYLIHTQALYVCVGRKKSEKTVRPSRKVKQILDRAGDR